jgi:IS30 family transposase
LLRPIKSKTAEAVAEELMRIFADFGAPRILHTDNGREFANRIVKHIVAEWPDCKLVHGKPRHSQSQGSVERANRDIEVFLSGSLVMRRKRKGRNRTEIGVESSKPTFFVA